MCREDASRVLIYPPDIIVSPESPHRVKLTATEKISLGKQSVILGKDGKNSDQGNRL